MAWWFNSYLKVERRKNVEDCNRVAGEDAESGKILTYGDLRDQAMKLALNLKNDYKVQPGDLVGVMIDASVDILIAYHGIWMAGAAYVFLDPDLPSNRLAYMVEDCSMDVIVTSDRYFVDISILKDKVSNIFQIFSLTDFLNGSSKELSEVNETEIYFKGKESVSACVVYTSGSTGEPKGVICTHSGLENICRCLKKALSLTTQTIFLQFANLSFDAPHCEIFPTLLAFGKVVFASREAKMPGPSLEDLIQKAKITHIVLPPTLLGMIDVNSEMLESLECVLCAGESLPLGLAKKWVGKPGRKLMNGYGPTETTIACSTCEILETDERITIGKPLSGVNIYIVDENGQLCPNGSVGQIIIGGKGVSLGYLNKPGLTKKKFVHLQGINEICYRSGDLGKFDENGSIICFGRIDNQIKIRGFRVETEEIENAMYGDPNVKTCAAISLSYEDADASEQKSLVLYLCVTNICSEESVKDFLRSRLPVYMVPNTVVFLNNMPLTQNNGKINRAALPSPDYVQKIEAFKLSGQELENGYFTENLDNLQIACRIFDSALGLPGGTISEDGDFFSFGGNSLKVNLILSDIERIFGISLPYFTFFKNANPIDLLSEINKCGTGNFRKLSNFSLESSLREETNYDFPFQRNSLKKPENHKQNNLAVLITGATGLLGSHIASLLCQMDKINRIYCIVRSKNDSEAEAKLKIAFQKYGVEVDSRFRLKITALSGDVAKVDLGLCEMTYEDLAYSVHIVVHSAADTSYIKPYASLKNTNVEGTKNILKFSATGNIKTFHHISSLSVYGSVGTLLQMDEVDEDFDLDISAPVLRFENGYVRSKWVAEVIATKARLSGLPLNIYRPGFILGNSKSGISNKNDFFFRLLMSTLQMGIYPDFPRKYWQVVPVDYVALVITQIIISQSAGKTYNITPDRQKEPSHNDIFQMLSLVSGVQLEKCSPQKWFEILQSVSSENHLYPVARFLTDKIYFERRTILEVYHYSPNITSKNTSLVCEKAKISCPKFDNDLMIRYVRFIQGSNLLELNDMITTSEIDKNNAI